MLGEPKAGELCLIRAKFVETRSDTDVQVVRKTRLCGGILFPSGQLELNNFYQVKRMVRGNRQHVVLDLLPKWARSSANLW